MKVRLPQGVGGGPSNMQSMIKQAQKMQEGQMPDTGVYHIPPRLRHCFP